MKELIREFPPGPSKTEKRTYISPEPLSKSPSIKKSAKKLNINRQLDTLKREGYCILENVFDDAFTKKIRNKIISLSNESKGDFKDLSAAMLLGRDPIFEKVVTNPRLLTVIEYAVGKGALLSQLLGGIRPKGAGNFEIHIDSAWTPAPLPRYPLMITACMPCDDFTIDSGPTKVIPRSHLARRQPLPREIKSEKGAIPIICKKGSLVFWLGSTWHGNYPRKKTGKRVVLHISFSRLMMRTIENYEHLDESWLKNKNSKIRTMLGRDDFLGTSSETSGGTDRSKTIKTFNKSHS
jgi:ectoine hydroxylase-related dioxygenase (phytanoyl-CoA dioxygenase family)